MKRFNTILYAITSILLFVLLMATTTVHAQNIPAPIWHTDGQKVSAGIDSQVSIARPDDVVAGDLIILIFTQTKTTTDASTSGFSTPTGFTRIHTEHGTASESRPEIVAFYKIADATEPVIYESIATSFAQTPLWKAMAVRVTGHCPDYPIAAISGANSGSASVNSLTIPSLTTTNNNSLLVNATAIRRSISGASVPVNMTHQWFSNGTGEEDSSDNAPALFGATQTIATAGATGTRQSNWTGAAQATGLMFAINPNPVNVDLKIEMSASPAPHYFADNVTITISVSNISETTDATDVKVNFMLPEGFGYISHFATLGSCIPSSGLWNIGNLPASATATNTIVATIVCGETHYSGSAVISGNEFDIDETNNTAGFSITPQAGGLNECPVIANDDYAYGAQGQPIQIFVLHNDKGDFDPDKVTIITQPSNGIVQLRDDGEMVYLPNGNFTGSDQFKYNLCNTDGSLCDDAIVYVEIQEDFTSPCLEATRNKTFYLPFPENKEQLRKAFFAAGTQSSGGTTVRNIISLKVPYPNTTIVYDHWEDGYEDDITVPTQATTQIWGDGNPNNGSAPGYPSDIIPAGASIIIDTEFAYNDRVQSSIQYDGKDKLFSSNNIFITKVTGDVGRFDVQNVKTDVLDVSRFGKIFRVGFGEDVNQPSGITAFRYVSLFIRAATDSTVVTIDIDGDGGNVKTKLLHEGEVWFYDGVGGTGTNGIGVVANDVNKPDDVKSSTVITASEPVGVDVLFGDIANYGTRNIYVLPSKFNSNEYITPVHTTNSDAPVVAYFTNNSTAPIEVEWETGSGSSGSFIIKAPNKTLGDVGYAAHSLSIQSAYRFKSTNNEPFTAMVVVDADNNGTAYDWAYPMIPVEQLTNYAGLAWAPGANTGFSQYNYNPIWVTSTDNTIVYVKWDGKMSDTGPNISPCGFPYDEAHSINALQSIRLLNTATNDQSGAAVFTCGAPIAPVWGQDANLAPASGNGAMDVGYVMQPGCLNHLIVANDDMEVTEPGEPVVVNVLGNDGAFLCTLNDKSLTTDGLLQPEHGTVVVNADGTITYTPNDSIWTGVDYFEYSLCAKEYPNTCDVALVTIKIMRCEDIAVDAGANVIKGRVFLQLKPDDGTYNGDESLVPGVRVDLYNDLNNNGIIDATDQFEGSTITDASGRYNFQTRGADYAADDFGTTTGVYNLNTGTKDWSAAWTRSDNTRVQSVVDANPTNSNNISLRINGSNHSASRSLLFSNASGAAVKFSYRRAIGSKNNKYLSVTLNGNTIYTITDDEGTGTDLFYTNVVIPVDTNYINKTGSNTLEFKTSGNNTNSDNFYIDNVELIYFPASFIATISDLNEDYIPALLNKAYYVFNGLGNCAPNQYIGVLAYIEAVNDSKNIITDTPTKINILSNDIGHPNPSSVTIKTQPTKGAVVVNPDGTVTYTPNPGYSGSDSFEYTVCSIDDPNVCDNATVTLNVQCLFVSGKNVINGLVFGDINLDGNYNLGESGIAGIEVELYEGANLLQTATTSELGTYQFEIDCEQTVRDEFEIRAYSNNDGTANWKTDWTETTDTGGATGGNINVTTDGKLRVSGNGNSSQISVSRSVDLSAASSAVLSYSYGKSSFNHSSNDWVEVQVSANGTSGWQVLKRYNGTAAALGSESFDISSYMGANTTIRFIESNNSSFSTSEYVLFDNVQITFIPTSGTKNYTVKLATALSGYNETTTPSTYNASFTGCQNASCSNNFGLGASDLAITKTVDNNEQFVGDNVVFTLVVTNYGPSNNTGVVAVDMPPSGYQYISDDGNGTYNPTTGEWDIGVLPVNTSDTLKITLKVLETGDFTNTATVSGDLPDPKPGNDDGTSTVSPEPWTDLKVVKTVSINPVEEVKPFTYSIMVTNLGPLTAEDVIVTDILDDALDIISITPSTGTWSAPEWTIGSLNVGDTVRLEIQCVMPMYSGILSLSNTATVRSDTHDKDFSNNTSTVTVSVEEFAGNYWMGGTATKENDWGEDANWTASFVPLPGEDIEFATVDNWGTAAVDDLHLDTDRVIGDLINASDKNLVITTGNQLIIEGEVIDTNAIAGTIVIKADSIKATGTLIFDDPSKNKNVQATVEFYNQAYECDDCGYYRNQWQYFGIPVKEADFPYLTPKVETVNQYVEPYNGNKWRPAPYAPDTKLKAFKGYEMTNSSTVAPTHIYQFAGVLQVGDTVVALTKTAGVNYAGMNLVSNSYTAAIPIAEDAIVDTANILDEETVYLFNTGTRDQWRKLNGSNVSGVEAGRYLAVPFNLAGAAGTLPAIIPSMHSFMLNAKASGNITLKYDVLEKIISDANTPTWRAKQRNQEHPFIVMDVIGSESADRVWLFEVDGSTTGFDNGWDGYKMLENGITQLYVSAEDNQNYQVASVPEILETTITLNEIPEENYQISFLVSEDIEYRNLYVHDRLTGNTYPLSDGAEYSIPTATKAIANRFKIVSDDLGDHADMSIVVTVIDRLVNVSNYSNEDCKVELYNASGKLIEQAFVDRGNTIKLKAYGIIEPGVYITKVTGQMHINKTTKVIIK